MTLTIAPSLVALSSSRSNARHIPAADETGFSLQMAETEGNQPTSAEEMSKTNRGTLHGEQLDDDNLWPDAANLKPSADELLQPVPDALLASYAPTLGLCATCTEGSGTLPKSQGPLHDTVDGSTVSGTLSASQGSLSGPVAIAQSESLILPEFSLTNRQTAGNPRQANRVAGSWTDNNGTPQTAKTEPRIALASPDGGPTSSPDHLSLSPQVQSAGETASPDLSRPWSERPTATGLWAIAVGSVADLDGNSPSSALVDAVGQNPGLLKVTEADNSPQDLAASPKGAAVAQKADADSVKQDGTATIRLQNSYMQPEAAHYQTADTQSDVLRQAANVKAIDDDLMALETAFESKSPSTPSYSGLWKGADHGSIGPFTGATVASTVAHWESQHLAHNAIEAVSSNSSDLGLASSFPVHGRIDLQAPSGSSPAQAILLVPIPAVSVAQIIEAVNPPQSGNIELHLTPEELGRVRISMGEEGERMVVRISAERPETLDLLRRNADQLAAELRTAGHLSLSMSFGNWGGSRNGNDAPSQMSLDLVEPPTVKLTPDTRHGATNHLHSGLYLRI